MALSKFRSFFTFEGDATDSAAVSSQAKQNVEESLHGLKVVAEGDKPVIDIVAIHGLNGNYDETWTAANGVQWLRDLLPTDMPNARILCWGYDARTHGDRVSCQYLHNHATELVRDLYLERECTDTTRRPIIFVAHSLGGIILKSALIRSDAARKGAQEEYRSIKTSTYGIMFMGTPHQGGSGVQMGKLLVNIASVFVAADDRLLKHLEKDSEWLQQQLEQYGPISGDFVTKFAYEEYKTPTAMNHSILVVPRQSAVVPGAADAEPIAIHADHVNMVRFSSKENNGYRTVSRHLRIMAKSACHEIASHWEKEDRINMARINSDEDFSLVFSLSEVIETNHFVARQEELATMHKKLGGGTGRQEVTLHGLGGVGKTQLAIAYAKAHASDYSAVLWLNIKDENSVKQSYARIARRIKREQPLASQLVSSTDESQLDKIVSAVRRWLDHAKNTRWLIVFDNYDNPKVPRSTGRETVNIQQFLPEAYHGSIIVTTRTSKVNIGYQIKVGKLGDVHDSLQILSDASHRDGVIADPDAVELAKELDGLPLALATAGAYLDQVATTFADYLRLYRSSWLKLQKTSPELSSYEDRQLYSTWQLSFDHIKEQNELSAQLLQLWAYFDNQDLWFDLLRELRTVGAEWLLPLTDELSFNEAVRVLCNHGLAEANQIYEASELESKGYGMHSCVHSWTIHVLNQEWNPETAGFVLECVGLHISVTKDTAKPWLARRRLMRHADNCEGFVLKGTANNKGREWALGNLGILFHETGRFHEAEQMYHRVLQGLEKAIDAPEHEWILDTVSNIGCLYEDLGRLDEAEQWCQRALTGRWRLLGFQHTSTLATAHNLGNIYRKLGRYGEAENMLQHVLRIREDRLGFNDTSTLDTMLCLANVYADIGKLDQAEKMWFHALQGQEKLFGPNNLKTLDTIHNLGRHYYILNRFDESEKWLQRALQNKREILGLDHKSTLDTANSLGMLYVDLGRFGDAMEMYRYALQGQTKSLGIANPTTLRTLGNLGFLYDNLGRSDLAEKMYQRTLQGYEKAFDHETLKTYNPALQNFINLAILYHRLGKKSESHDLYLRALNGFEKVYGQENSRCQQIRANMTALKNMH